MRKRFKEFKIRFFTTARKLYYAPDLFLDKIIGNHKYNKFVVLSYARTGSTLLITLLNSHPNVEAHYERFLTLQGKTCKKIWNDIFSRKRPYINLVGFKIFYYHPQDSDDRSVWDYIKQDENIKIIHLKRKNMLENLASLEIAEKTDKWAQRTPLGKIKTEKKKITIPKERCLERFENIKKWDSIPPTEFKNHETYTLYYEDLINNKEHVLKEIQSFLGLPEMPLKSILKKQNPEPIDQLITNFDELKNTFQDTEWEYLFEG